MALHRIPELSSFNWQQNVLNQVTAPTGSESQGARYIVKATATGIFAGLEGKVVTANDPDGTPTLLADWIVDTPSEGWQLWDETANTYYYYNGSAWVAYAAGHTQNTDTGTTSASFQLDNGNSGPKLKNNSGVVEARNAADNAYVNIRAADVVSAGNITDGTNATSPAQIKSAYDGRAVYNASLKCITFDI